MRVAIQRPAVFLIKHAHFRKRAPPIPGLHTQMMLMGMPEDLVEKVCSTRPTVTPKHVESFCSFARTSFNLGQEDSMKLLSRFPHVVTQDVASLEKRVAFFKSAVLLTQEELTNVIMSYPQLLSRAVDGLAETCQFLKDEVGMSQQQIHEAVVRFGFLLASSVVDTLRPALRYLLQNNFCPHDLCVMATKEPKILCTSLEKLSTNITNIITTLRMNPNDFPRMAKRAPSVLLLSDTNKIQPCLDFFLKTLELPVERACHILSCQPRLFGASVSQNLIPKVKYFTDHVGVSREMLLVALQANTATLCYSLSQRIIPRHLILVDNDKFPRANALSSQPLQLKGLGLSLTDKSFCNKYGIPPPDYRKYLVRGREKAAELGGLPRKPWNAHESATWVGGWG